MLRAASPSCRTESACCDACGWPDAGRWFRNCSGSWPPPTYRRELRGIAGKSGLLTKHAQWPQRQASVGHSSAVLRGWLGARAGTRDVPRTILLRRLRVSCRFEPRSRSPPLGATPKATQVANFLVPRSCYRSSARYPSRGRIRLSTTMRPGWDARQTYGSRRIVRVNSRLLCCQRMSSKIILV